MQNTENRLKAHGVAATPIIVRGECSMPRASMLNQASMCPRSHVQALSRYRPVETLCSFMYGNRDRRDKCQMLSCVLRTNIASNHDDRAIQSDFVFRETESSTRCPEVQRIFTDGGDR